jgi:hypothetical protein
MKVISLLVAILSLVLPATAFQGEGGEKRPLPPGVPEMIPDPEWEPKSGEVATAITDSYASIDLRNYSRFKKFREANDQVGLDQMLKAGQVIRLGKGDQALVLRYYGAGKPKFVSRTMSMDEFFNRLQTAGPAQPPETSPVEVRVQSGEKKGLVVFLSDDGIGRLISNPTPWLPARPGMVFVLGDPRELVARDAESLHALHRVHLLGRPEEEAKLVSREKAFRLNERSRVTVVELYTEPATKAVAKVRVTSGGIRTGAIGFIHRSNLFPVPVEAKPKR